MSETSGNQRLVLNAVHTAQGENRSFVSDHQIAASTSIDLRDVRDSIEILRQNDLLEVARTNAGLMVSLTAKGRQRLGQFQPFPTRQPTNHESLAGTTPTVSLRVEFSESNQGIVTSKLDFKDGRGPQERTYIRLNVTTDVRYLAKNCRVVLDQIEEVTKNGTIPVHYPTRLRLLWSKEKGGGLNEGGRDIHKGNPEIVDLLYTDSDGNNQWIVLRDIQHTSGGLLSFNKRYRFRVTATAENEEPVEIVMDAICGPRPKDVRVLEPSPLTIRSYHKTTLC